jgi:SNF2 family DNA or RNA helicase
MNLQAHQEAALEYFLHSENRGMLLWHGTGSGKTLTAIAIAEKFKQYKEVIVLSPKSLQDNFKKELKRYTKNNQQAQARYSYISSNAGNMISKLETSTDEITQVSFKSLKLEHKFIIVDEAHNMFVGMVNGSKNATGLYDMLMKAKNCKILFLTASGIVNNFYEIIPCLNICKGYIQSEDGDKLTLFPESYEDFIKYFVNEAELKLKNVNKLRNRMFGLVSYKGDLYEHKVDSFYKSISETIKKENYPDRKPIKLDIVHMSGIQYASYEQAREKERLETRQAIVGSGKNIILNHMDKPKNPYLYGGHDMIENIKGGELTKTSAFGNSTSYRIKSRQISNVYHPDGKDIDYSNIEEYSPKIAKIGSRLKPGTKTIIYSNFVQAGIVPMSEYLEHIGYKRYTPGTDTSGQDSINGYYGIYTGDVKPEDRTATLNEYNNPNSPLTILLISSSGAEGLSSKGTRVVHVMEPYWNIERLLQVYARAVRYKSHEHLPEKERNVQIYLYLAVAPKDTKTTELSTDMNMFTQSVKKYEMNAQMTKLVASVAVDCRDFNTNVNFECYKCVPKNNAPLYINDLDKDMKYKLPCTNDKKPINVKEIKLSGKLYYVNVEDKKIFYKKDDEYIEIIDPDVVEYILTKIEN